MKRIIYTDASGQLLVVRPVINTHTLVDGEVVPIKESLAEDQALARAMAKLPADAIDPQIVDELAIPTDRTFRNAWKAGVKAVTHDMEKCREIHRTALRQLRAPKLAALDVAFMRALEAGDLLSQKAIAAKKQALRDVTSDPAIESALTPEALKVVRPKALEVS